MNVPDKEPRRNSIELVEVGSRHEAAKCARFTEIDFANRGIGQKGSKKP